LPKRKKPRTLRGYATAGLVKRTRSNGRAFRAQ
jgi:hypothetical protein